MSEPKININIAYDSVTYSGEEIYKVTQEDLKRLLKVTYTSFDVTDFTEKVVSVKSATVKRFNNQPVILRREILDNPSDKNAKPSAGISYTTQNTVGVSWSNTEQTSLSESIQVGLSWHAVALVGHDYSRTTTVGKNEDVAETVTLGSTSAVEVELKPGESALVELTANTEDLEVEIVYQIYYRGEVTYFQESLQNETNDPVAEKVSTTIERVLEQNGINNEENFTQTIVSKFNVNGRITIKNLTR